MVTKALYHFPIYSNSNGFKVNGSSQRIEIFSSTIEMSSFLRSFKGIWYLHSNCFIPFG